MKPFFLAASLLSLLGSLLSLLGSLSAANCPAEPKADTQSTAFRELVFAYNSILTPDKQQEIAAALRKHDHAAQALVSDEAAERVRVAYQDEGYFMAKATAKAEPAGDGSQRYDIVVGVTPGRQYRMGDLSITHSKAFSEAELLDFFPLQRGEIFSRKEIALGLEELRHAYTSRGYVNFVAVPGTRIDEESAKVDLQVDVDEGKQFRLRSLEIIGLDPQTKARVVDALNVKAGDLYANDLWDRVTGNFPQLAESFDRHVVESKFDESDGWVDATLDFTKNDICADSSLSPASLSWPSSSR